MRAFFETSKFGCSSLKQMARAVFTVTGQLDEVHSFGEDIAILVVCSSTAVAGRTGRSRECRQRAAEQADKVQYFKRSLNCRTPYRNILSAPLHVHTLLSL